MSSDIEAQNNNTEWQVGYFAPYISNIGGIIGYAFELKNLGDDSKESGKSEQCLQILTQLGYFTQPNVSYNFLFNPELVYKWNKMDGRFFLFSSIGTGYLLSFQRQEGILNLGSGEKDYRNEALIYFLPTLNMGLGIDQKKHMGFYIKTNFGRKLSIQDGNAGLIGISTGLILKFNSKKIINDTERIYR